jgi:hypothetical protein
MIMAEGTGIALVGLATSVETLLGVALEVIAAAQLKPQAVRSGTITQLPLKKCSLCRLLPKGLKVRSGEFPLNQHEGVAVAMGAVVIVHGGNELNLFAKPLFQGKHGVDGDLG